MEVTSTLLALGLMSLLSFWAGHPKTSFWWSGIYLVGAGFGAMMAWTKLQMEKRSGRAKETSTGMASVITGIILVLDGGFFAGHYNILQAGTNTESWIAFWTWVIGLQLVLVGTYDAATENRPQY